MFHKKYQNECVVCTKFVTVFVFEHCDYATSY